MRRYTPALVIAALLSVVGLWVSAQTPLTPAANLRVSADSSGNAMTAYATMTGSAGPLTPLANLRLRADSSGNLLVTSTAGTTTTPDTTCLNTANQDVCLQRQAAGILNLTNTIAGTTFSRVNFGTAIVTNPALKVSGAGLIVRLADDSANAALTTAALTTTGSVFVTGAGSAFGVGNTSMVNTSPTATTFCTTPVVTANGTAAFQVNVGTACATSTATITLPAATTAWVADCHNVTVPASNVVEQTGGTTTTITLTNYARTTGLASNWTDGHVIRCKAMAY